MASIWSIDGNNIYIDKDQEDHPAQVAELNPINSTASIFHSLFTPTETKSVQGTVIGEAVKDAIMATKDSIVSLISDLVPGGESVFVQKAEYERVLVSKQRVDTSFPTDAPVYRVSLTLRPQ